MSAKKKQQSPRKARRPARKPRPRAKGRPSAKSRPKRPAARKASKSAKAKPKPKQSGSAQRQKAQRAKELERARLLKEREREQARREREREQAARQKQRAAEQREREREKAQQARERERAQKEAARERSLREKEKQREREAAKKEAQKQREADEKRKKLERERAARERSQLKKQRDRERIEAKKARDREAAKKKVEQKKLLAQREKERAAALKAKAAEKQRQAVEKERQREEAKRLREQERAAQKAERVRQREEEKREREAERARLVAEKEREREEARRIKEEERARKEAEREAYRKAKEAERERLRAEREAARRALESRVARATRNAQRAAARGSTTRVYRPDAIPNQSGTTRRVDGQMPRFGHFVGTPITPPQPTPPPPPPPEEGETEYLEVAPEPGVPAEALDESAAATGDAGRVISEEEQRRLSLVERVAPEDQTDQRWASIQERLARASDDFRREYRESFDMSWVYHDSALEGVVYTFQELKTAIDPNITVVPDSSLQPVCEEIRRHNAAIELVRELSEKKRVPITVDVVKRIYLTLHPEEGDLKSVKYRKDIPQHRLYFHEYAQPDKIAYKVRQVTDWLNGPEPKKLKNPVKIAARVHYDLLRTFPFPTDSGKVARLLSNLILMRSGYPPAIIHSTERQRYYEALKGSLQTIVNLTNEAIENGFQSIEKRLEDYEARARATV